MLKPYALFDFDGTLAKGDSIVPFCLYACKCGFCGVGSLFQAGVAGILYLLRVIDAKRSKELSLHFLKGRTLTEVEALAQGFCRDVLLPHLYADGKAEMEARVKEGAEAWIISASPSFYLQPLQAYLPLTGVIGTRLAVDENGVLTGDIAGENCRWVEKPLRLAEVLAARGDMLDYAVSYAYGDTAGDEPMLALCAHKVAVNPKKKLMQKLKGAQGVITVRWK